MKFSNTEMMFIHKIAKSLKNIYYKKKLSHLPKGVGNVGCSIIVYAFPIPRKIKSSVASAKHSTDKVNKVTHIFSSS